MTAHFNAKLAQSRSIGNLENRRCPCAVNHVFFFKKKNTYAHIYIYIIYVGFFEEGHLFNIFFVFQGEWLFGFLAFVAFSWV